MVARQGKVGRSWPRVSTLTTSTPEDETMPWLAQVPEAHPFWAEAGTQFEQVLLRLGYVETRAPGAEHDDNPAEPAAPEQAEDTVTVDEQLPEPPVRASRRRR